MEQLLTLPSRQERRADGRRNRSDCTTRAASRGILHLVAFLIIAAVFSRQTLGAPAAQFASGVDLVEVYATVTDPRGDPIAGLTASDFQVLEDGDPQSIAAFAAGEFPLAVAVAVDRSFSMRARLPQAKAAARAFVSALRPDDRVMVVAIGSETDIVSPLSADHRAAADAIDRLDAWGTTPLYDAMRAAVDDIQHANGRRALVVLSDGVDRYSETTPARLVDDTRRRDVLIYPIAMGGTRAPVLVEVASVTGGRPFFAAGDRDLTVALDSIARELRSQYLLGYSSTNKRGTPGDWRSIRVIVNRSDVRVRARDGYVVK